jgi:uncharacterized alpha-E superfamily protein
LNTHQALQALTTLSMNLAAITGAQTDRMTRDSGWRLMSMGRQLERMGFLSNALQKAQALELWYQVAGFENLLALFDSTITFRAQFQQSRELPPLLALLVMDRGNPRALACVSDNLRRRLHDLVNNPSNGQLNTLASALPDPSEWSLESLLGSHPATVSNLEQVLAQCQNTALALPDLISAVYFTHSLDTTKTLGA